MAGLDLSGFNVPEQKFGGLYQAANTLERRRERDDELSQQKQGKQAATSKFLTDYLDPKDHLTGTNYDPQIVSGFQDVLQKAQELVSKGANTSDILMAIGPSVSKLNQYSTTAKAINQRIKDQVGRLKQYPGYNLEALQSQALKNAFYGPDGKLKDISTVDPNEDWIMETVKSNPELVTTSKSLDDFVTKTPMSDYSRNVQTAYAGRTKNVKYEAKHPFWEDLQKDSKGNILTDASGNPMGLGVIGADMVDDNGKPIVNPDTKKPFQVMDKGAFNAVMSHNPDVADYIRGQVNQHFRDAGAKQVPAENSPQWDMMARHILHDELQTRSRSSFRTIEQQKETAPAIKVELGNDPKALEAMARYQQANKLKGEYSVYDPKAGKATKTNAVQAIGKFFNNDPAFLQGEQEDVNGRSVINVTEFLPGGGLKSGRGADEVYKSIWYDPAKRSLLVSVEGKHKDASGTKPIKTEEIPESKAGQFMARIAAANGVDPDKVSDLLTEMGYKGAKFTNVLKPDDANKRMQEEHSARVDGALKDNDFGKLKGIQVKDGVIEEISERTKSSWIPGVDKYAVYVKTTDGKTVKAFTTSDKQELDNYVKGISLKSKANTTQAKPSTLDQKEKTFIDKAAEAEAFRQKYNY